ncbi:MAG: MmgE/PrpD family protein [Chloroflexi bacterium]|nr:MmgE/PrpD family protein [Chloroflexota bacterium]
MDRVLQSLTDYAMSLTYRELSGEAVHQVKRLMIDSMGCALAAHNEEPVRISRSHAIEVTANPGATVFGTTHRTAPELAAFANTAMVRYLDFNDTGLGFEVGHPSDNIPAVLAAAEYAGAPVQTALLGIVLAYEIVGCMGQDNRLMQNGWDYVTYDAISSAAGAGKALNLTREQMANAIALAAVSSFSLGQTRAGALSMWKGCAAANAVRNGVFAALMALRGMTGPLEAFEGPRGFLKHLAGPITLPSCMGTDHVYEIQKAKIKYFPADYEAQTAVHAVLELREILGGRTEDIDKVIVDTYDLAIAVAADGPEKWRPANRETADHSLPYILAVAFINGDVWLDDYAEDRIRDPGVRDFMQKIEVRQTEECQRDFPQANPFRIEMITRSGQRHVREVKYGKGHPKNPMTDGEVETKFHRLTNPVLKPGQADRILDRLWHFEGVRNIEEVLKLCVLQ